MVDTRQVQVRGRSDINIVCSKNGNTVPHQSLPLPLSQLAQASRLQSSSQALKLKLQAYAKPPNFSNDWTLQGYRLHGY
jgi:hypothetical protein